MLYYHRFENRRFKRIVQHAVCCLGFIFLLGSMGCKDNNLPNLELVTKATQLYKDGKKDSAKAIAADLIRSESPYIRFRGYRLKGGWCYMENKYDSNGIYIDSMIYALEKNDLIPTHETEYAEAEGARGDHYFVDNNMPKAFELYMRAKEAAAAGKDTCAFNNCSYHLGMVYYRQENYTEAIVNFREAYRYSSACPDNEIRFYRKEELLNNIALAYTELKVYDSAMLYYNKALSFAISETKRLHLPPMAEFTEKAAGVTYGCIAKIFIAEHRPDTAEKLLQRSIDINSRPGFETWDAMSASMQLAELYFGERKLPQTISTLNVLKQALDTVVNNDIKLRWLHLMYDYHKAIHDDARALGYMEGYTMLHSSLDSASRKLKQTDYGLLFKNKEAQFEIQLLKKDKQLDQLYLLITIVLSVMAVAIIALVYTNYRRGRKNIAQLTLLHSQVSEQKEKLEDTLSMLQQTLHDKDRIMHVVAHDLRNPIGGILSLSDIMVHEELNEEHKEYMDMIITASNNSLTLINEILEFSGNTAGHSSGEKEAVDINELIKQATGILKFKADEKEQTIVTQLFPETIYILSQPGKIGRVLGNLISNAIKFSPKQSTIELLVQRNDTHITIEVRDHGIGIPDKYKPLVFQTFTAAKRHGTSGEISFGLGLSICKQIMEAHNGTIKLESEEGKGTSFFIVLPIYRVGELDG